MTKRQYSTDKTGEALYKLCEYEKQEYKGKASI